MICFDVFVNGEKVCRAGGEEMAVMGCNLSFVRANEHHANDEVRLTVGGLLVHTYARIHPRWAEELELKAGDEVTVRIVEADSADEPTEEVVYTSQDDDRSERKYFERLKAKYEGDS